MAVKPKQPNFAGFTKAELLKTIKTLHARQTKLLNEIAALKGKLDCAMGVPSPGLEAAVPQKPRRTRKPKRSNLMPLGGTAEWTPPWA